MSHDIIGKSQQKLPITDQPAPFFNATTDTSLTKMLFLLLNRYDLIY